MDNDAIKRIEHKLETAINLMVGVFGAIMSLAVLYSGEQYGQLGEKSVLLAAITFFITTLCLQKMIKHV